MVFQPAEGDDHLVALADTLDDTVVVMVRLERLAELSRYLTTLAREMRVGVGMVRRIVKRNIVD